MDEKEKFEDSENELWDSKCLQEIIDALKQKHKAEVTLDYHTPKED